MADETKTESPTDGVNAEAFEALGARSEQGPVVMLNLLKFEPDGGLESYMRYAEAVAPLLAAVGGSIDYSGAADELLIGGEDWDMVALVRYPSRGAFLEMVMSDAYRAIVHLREDAVVRSVLYATNPLSEQGA